jgi:transcriptional regulator with XRE-family HTH domain
VRTFSTIWTKLRQNGATYRKALVGSELKRIIPFQIFALRKKRGWSQEELAKRSGLTQGVISRAEDPDYGNLTFNTVISIAGGFDVAFIGRFSSFSELDDYLVELSEESAGLVPSFEEEDREISEQRRIPYVTQVRRRRYVKQSKQTESVTFPVMPRVPISGSPWIPKQGPTANEQSQTTLPFEPAVRSGAAAPIIEFPEKVGMVPQMFAPALRSAVGAGAQYGR